MFVSFFFPVFLGSVILLFFLLPARWRPAVLLLSSWFFCGYLETRALIIMVLISVCSYGAGIGFEELRQKELFKQSRWLTIAAVCLCIMVLAIYKYAIYFLQRLGIADSVSSEMLENLIMPVGLSFYFFQAIGYLVDVYQGKSRAERNFWYLGCYFAFFAKLISGPIEREDSFLAQMQKIDQVRFWNRGRLSEAFTYMLWGYFMKMVVADRLAVPVGVLFENPQNFDSFWLLIGALFYTIQIYCDFAGYSYIAIGCARIFGLNLTQNFKSPYLAENITDFWRRWHISLSSWLRDYVYIPLGGSRKGDIRKCLNTMTVFLICGAWHGVGFNYIAWGMLHGAYSVADFCLKKRGKRVPGGKIMTFCAVMFAWIFFRASSLRGALRYLGNMVTMGVKPGQWLVMMEQLQLNTVEIVVIVLAIGIIWLTDLLSDAGEIQFPELVQKKKNANRYLIFYILIIVIFIFGMYGPGYHAEQFIYMQF